ncbi:MAG: hypothetical protein GY747_02455 [Planctomycetes bacterium]|nr:hypothetical protein [Planctomycetota bacterium]MCP4770239.1 hypothetical protein [Planctomycetota bacterium]MCP4860613.1 hypothetical protein [Planctomycetota bacterium]
MTIRFAIPLLLALLASCSFGPQIYEVQVDAQATEPQPESQSYVLASAMEGTSTSDLQFQEFASYLNHALQDQGYRPAFNRADADLVISLAYGISEAIEKKEYYRQPIWETNDAPYVYRAIPTGSRRDCPTSIGYYPAPRHRIVGYTEGSRTVIVFDHTMQVFAMTSRQIGSSMMSLEQWSVDCKVTDARGDLRVTLPVMLAGARIYFGKSSGRTVIFELEEDHPDVLQLMGEPSP